MKQLKENISSPDLRINISKSGYRILLLLNLLMESPKSKQEINEAFKNDRFIHKGVSEDTITNTVNALRKTGCVIDKPNINTNYKYILKNHPFKTGISVQTLEALQKIRNGIASFSDWQLLKKVNNLYAKFAEYTHDEDSAKKLLYDHPLKDVSYEILDELTKHCIDRQILKIDYISPIFSSEELIFIPDFIAMENNVLQLWGYNFKYKDIGYLRIDRIRKVEVADFHNPQKILNQYEKSILTVSYKLTGYSMLAFQSNRFERIVIENENYLVIEAKVYNKFNFYQRIISYGTDCKILSPESYIEEFIIELKRIKECYRQKNDKK